MKYSRTASIMLGGFLAVAASSGAQAMNCGAALDELTKAVSGHVSMSPARKAAMLRMVMASYDSCEAGDTASAGATRDMVMDQLKKTLGGR